MKDKIIPIVAVLALVIYGWSVFRPASTAQFPIGSAGNLLAENYIPYVMYNDGYKSNKDIVTTADLETSGTFTMTGDATFGTNGTALDAIKTGSCTIWAPSQTISATSSQQAVCQGGTGGSGITAITGITTDSICDVIMASSTNTTSGTLVVAGASASSTAGNIVVRIANFTGADFSWTAAASSSAQWNYQCFDPS